MTNEVVTHTRFRIDAEGLDRLRAMGVEVLTDFPSDEEMELLAPQFGETVLGTLTDEEFAIFVGIWRCQNELTLLFQTITARKLRDAADKVMSTSDLGEFIQGVQSGMKDVFADDEEAKRAYELTARMNFLKGLFYYELGTKYACHEYWMGVRSGRRFVHRERRY